MARGHLLLSLKTWRHPLEIPLILAVKYLTLWVRATVRAARQRSFTPLVALAMASLPISPSRYQLAKTD